MEENNPTIIQNPSSNTSKGRIIIIIATLAIILILLLYLATSVLNTKSTNTTEVNYISPTLPVSQKQAITPTPILPIILRKGEEKTLISAATIRSTEKSTSENQINVVGLIPTTIQVDDTLKVSADLHIEPTAEASSSSYGGLIVGNGLKRTDPNARAVAIFYKNSAWRVAFMQSTKIVNPTKLYDDTSRNTTFDLLLNQNAKSITILLPNGKEVLFDLPESLYSATGSRTLVPAIFANNGFTVSISRLLISYP